MCARVQAPASITVHQSGEGGLQRGVRAKRRGGNLCKQGFCVGPRYRAGQQMWQEAKLACFFSIVTCRETKLGCRNSNHFCFVPVTHLHWPPALPCSLLRMRLQTPEGEPVGWGNKNLEDLYGPEGWCTSGTPVRG